VKDGTSAYSGSADNGYTNSTLVYISDFSTAKSYSIRHWTSSARATDGLGIASDNNVSNPQATEIFASVIVEQLAKY
jgi:hypothetical protein